MSRWLNETTSQKTLPARASLTMRVRIFSPGWRSTVSLRPGYFSSKRFRTTPASCVFIAVYQTTSPSFTASPDRVCPSAGPIDAMRRREPKSPPRFMAESCHDARRGPPTDPNGAKPCRRSGVHPGSALSKEHAMVTFTYRRHYPRTMSERTAWLVAGFVFGALAVLIFHQGAFALLHSIGFTPRSPYSMQSTAPWSVPQIWSTTFWCGVWGVLLAAAVP